MSNLAIVKENSNSNAVAQRFSSETVELIKNTVAPKDLTPSEFEMFMYQANRTGLDPLSRQIYCIKNKDKVSIQATIDGFRLIAERTGQYEGQTPVLWCGNDGEWKDVWIEAGYPVAAKVGVLRTGFTQPLYAVAKFDTYCQRYGDKVAYNWNKMPDLMIGKCAEALALRKAFPQELSNIYSSDEMANIDDNSNESEKPAPPKPNVNKAAADPERAKKVKEFIAKLEKATTREELERSVKEVPEEFHNDKFNAYVQRLREKFPEDISQEDVIEEAEVVNYEDAVFGENPYLNYSLKIGEAKTKDQILQIKALLEEDMSVGNKDTDDLMKMIDTKLKKLGGTK